MEIGIFLLPSSLPCWLELPLGCCPAEQPALAQGCSGGAGLVCTPSSLCVLGFCWMLRALAHRAPQPPPSAKRCHKSLPDGWEVIPWCCLGALKAFSTEYWTAPMSQGCPKDVTPAGEAGGFPARCFVCPGLAPAAPVMKRRT